MFFDNKYSDRMINFVPSEQIYSNHMMMANTHALFPWQTVYFKHLKAYVNMVIKKTQLDASW